MEQAVRRDERPAVDGPLARHVGRAPAGFLDEQERRRRRLIAGAICRQALQWARTGREKGPFVRSAVKALLAVPQSCAWSSHRRRCRASTCASKCTPDALTVQDMGFGQRHVCRRRSRRRRPPPRHRRRCALACAAASGSLIRQTGRRIGSDEPNQRGARCSTRNGRTRFVLDRGRSSPSSMRGASEAAALRAPEPGASGRRDGRSPPLEPVVPPSTPAARRVGIGPAELAARRGRWHQGSRRRRPAAPDSERPSGRPRQAPDDGTRWRPGVSAAHRPGLDGPPTSVVAAAAEAESEGETRLGVPHQPRRRRPSHRGAAVRSAGTYIAPLGQHDWPWAEAGVRIDRREILPRPRHHPGRPISKSCSRTGAA